MFDRYTYVVVPKKRKVIAYSTYAGQGVRGIAKCAPDDKFDIEFGKKLAAARCNVKVARKRLKRALERRDMAWEEFAQIEERLLKEEDYVDDANVALTEAEVYLESIMRDYEAAAENVQYTNVSEVEKRPCSDNKVDVTVSYKTYEPPKAEKSFWARVWEWLINN